MFNDGIAIVARFVTTEIDCGVGTGGFCVIVGVFVVATVVGVLVDDDG